MQPLGTKSADLNEEMQTTNRERRQRVRHRVHTPAYASLNGNSRGTELDLSEILDISEEGMAIQTVSPLEINSSLKLSLDLSDTRAYIHATGQVIWSDSSGRVGIRFLRIEPPLGELREWLFQNALSACANHAAGEPSEFSRHEESQDEPSVPLSTVDEPEGRTLEGRDLEDLAPAPPDYTTILTALAVVTREVEAAGPDLEAALNVVAERARTFTRSTGAAVALSQGAEMICVATAGLDAPGLGSRLQVGSGFSGECVRTGRLLRCEDSETDPRVDRESCRALGIRSMIAVPIRLGDSVVGLLEAFSPEPNTFNTTDDLVLQRLAETALAAINRAARSSIEKARSIENLARQTNDPAAVDQPAVPEVKKESVVSDAMSYSRKILLGAAAVLLIVLVWLVAPWIKGGSSSSQSHPRSSTRAAMAAKTPAATSADAGSIEGLQQLAQQGDAAAQYALGVHYATGDGVKQDYSEAVAWFSKAAEQGQVMAQATLGTYYWAGRGVPKDISKAYFWTILAQAGGDKSSKAYVSILTTGMTRSQILVAQQAADEWLKQHRVTGKISAVVQ